MSWIMTSCVEEEENKRKKFGVVVCWWVKGEGL